MQKSTFFIIIFILALAGILYYVYSNYEKKTTENYFNVSISAMDKDRIITGYEIQPLGIFGSTSYSYEQLNLPSGIIQITNRNIGRQNYYEDTHEYNISSNIRIDLILKKPEIPKIKITDEDTIILQISSNNFQDIDFCLDSSINYIFLKAEPRLMKYFMMEREIKNIKNKIEKENITIRVDKYVYTDYPEYVIIKTFENLTNYNEITKEGYEDYDVCYDGEFSIVNDVKILNISYTELSKKSNGDYIRIALIDKEGNKIVENIK